MRRRAADARAKPHDTDGDFNPDRAKVPVRTWGRIRQALQSSMTAGTNENLAAVLCDPARIAALRATGLLDSPPEKVFDRLTDLARRMLGVPVCLVSLVEIDRQFFKSCVGLPEPWASLRETHLSHSFCQHVVHTGAPLVVEDAREHPLLRDNLAIRDLNVIAYLGIPLLTPDAQTVGSFCAIDTKPRTWTPDEIGLMGNLAESVTSEIALRHTTINALRESEAELRLRNAELRAAIMKAESARLLAEQTAAALRESEDRYRGIFLHAGTGIAISDLKGQFQSCNPAYTAMLGYSEEELRKIVFAELVHPDDREANMLAVRRLLAGEVPSFEIVNRYLRKKEGAPLWVHQHVSLMRSAEGRPSYMIALASDITGRKQAEATRARLAAIVTSSSEAIISKTLAGTITSWNEAAERIFGYPAHEMAGASIRRIVPARQAEEDDILACIARGERVQSYETERLRKDGRTIAVSVTVSPILDEAGKIIGASKIAHDITERKRAEEQIKLLLNEVNHRAKNMLALVQAIARQTLAANPNDFIDRFGERIRSLAASQDLLVDSQWKGTDLRELVRSQMAHVSDLVDRRIMLKGPPLFITASAAQTIGMAVHELATNAGKYGALSNGDGCIRIEWGVSARAAGDRFAMSWCEQGGPPVAAPSRRGFGSTVIRDAAEMNLDAAVDFDFLPEGLSWRLECAAAEITG